MRLRYAPLFTPERSVVNGHRNMTRVIHDISLQYIPTNGVMGGRSNSASAGFHPSSASPPENVLGLRSQVGSCDFSTELRMYRYRGGFLRIYGRITVLEEKKGMFCLSPLKFGFRSMPLSVGTSHGIQEPKRRGNNVQDSRSSGLVKKGGVAPRTK